MRTFLLTTLLCLLLAQGASAEVYVAAELGPQFAPGLSLRGGDNDRASRCDEFVNPRYAELDGCTDPERGAGAVDSWRSEFDRTWGLFAGAAIGYRFRDRFRVELEAFHSEADYDESSDLLDPSGVAFTQIFGAELPQAYERVGKVSAAGAFLNLYLDLPGSDRFTPFIGIGPGLGFTRMDYGALWERSNDPNKVETARGLPNEAEVRRNLAGTVSSVDHRLRDLLHGYQVLFGVDYKLTEALSVELRGRWTDLSDFTDRGDYDRLRSHVSNLRRDGSEPVRYRVSSNDMEFFSVALRLNYRFLGPANR